MSSYLELITIFEKNRGYMRAFYVYGFIQLLGHPPTPILNL